LLPFFLLHAPPLIRRFGVFGQRTVADGGLGAEAQPGERMFDDAVEGGLPVGAVCRQTRGIAGDDEAECGVRGDGEKWDRIGLAGVVRCALVLVVVAVVGRHDLDDEAVAEWLGKDIPAGQRATPGQRATQRGGGLQFLAEECVDQRLRDRRIAVIAKLVRRLT